MGGGCQCGVLICLIGYKSIFYSSIFSLSGYTWPSGGHSGGPSLVSMGSAPPQSLEPPSGRRSGDPPRFYQMGVRGSCSGRLALTPGGLSYGLLSRSLICT